MAIKHMDGFEQYRGLAGAALLSALTSAAYAVTSGLAITDGRKIGTNALELQVSAGAGGASWSSRNTTIKADLHAVAANAAGRFVAIGDAGSGVATVDGITWTPVVLGVSVNMKGLKCHNSTFIGVGENGTIIRSTDGQVWTVRTPPNSTAILNDVEWGNGMWIAVGSIGSAGAIFVSTDDGLTWDNVTNNPGTRGNLSARYANGVFMVGGVGGQLLTSANGLVYTSRAYGSVADVADLGFDNGTWLGLAGQSIRRSVDNGITWTVAADTIIAAGVLLALAVSNGRWVTGANNGLLYMSDDTNNWTQPAFTGAGNRAIYDINTSSAANAGWCLVGARAPGSTGTALIYVSLAPPTVITRTLVSAVDKIVIGFAHRATARGRIFSIANLFNMDWPAGISILGQSGASVPIRSTWYYYEIVIDKNAQTITLYVNDTLDLTVALPAGGAAMTTFTMSWQAENGAVARIDDVYLLDADTAGGAALVDRLKPISMGLRLPTADVEVDWEPSSPGDHWSKIGLLPASPSSFVSSAVPSAQDIYSSSNALPEGAGTAEQPIIAVGLVALAQKSDLDNRQLGLLMGAPGNQIEVIDTTLSITPEYSMAVFEKAPGNVAWTPENVQSTPFGIAVRP